MKKNLFFTRMTLTAMFLTACLTACKKDEVEPTPKPNPVTPTDTVKTATDKKLAFNISLAQWKGESAPQTLAKAGDGYGIILADNRKMVEYTDGGFKTDIKVKQADTAYVFTPYLSDADGKVINADLTKQQDIMIGKAAVSPENVAPTIEMNHAFTRLRIEVSRKDYSGRGEVSEVKLTQTPVSAAIDLTRFTVKPLAVGELKIEKTVVVEENKPVVYELLVAPGNNKDCKVSMQIDERTLTFDLPLQDWQPGTIVKQVIELEEPVNQPTTSPAYNFDRAYWSTFGKNDPLNIVAPTTDKFRVAGIGFGEGKTLYRNKVGKIYFGGSWSNVNNDYTGNIEFKMVLLDRKTGKIVEQFPVKTIKGRSSLLDTYQNVYVTAAPDIYRLGVLFRRAGQSNWVMGKLKNINVKEEELYLKVEEQNGRPTLFDIRLSGDKSKLQGIEFVNEEKPFTLDYHLFNPGTHLKGEIIAVWERTFKVLGTMYTPYQKLTSETRNDDEWEDEIGRMKIDIPADVKEWKGRITCRFTVKREKPQYYVGEGKWNGYCSPTVHLYYIPEGGNERIFLTCEADHKLVTKDFIYHENYVNIFPSRWK